MLPSIMFLFDLQMENFNLHQIFTKVTTFLELNKQNHTWQAQKDETLEIVVIHKKIHDHIPEELKKDLSQEIFSNTSPCLNSHNSNGVDHVDKSLVPILKYDPLDDDYLCTVKQEDENGFITFVADSPLQDQEDDGVDVHDEILQHDMVFYDDGMPLKKQSKKKVKPPCNEPLLKKTAKVGGRDKKTSVQKKTSGNKRKPAVSCITEGDSEVKKPKSRSSNFPIMRKDDQGMYKCPECPVEYTCHSNVMKHYTKYHHDPVNVSCQHCPLVFKYKVSLDAHCDFVHNDGSGKHVCTKCGMIYQMLSNLRRHEKQKHMGLVNNQIHCPFCDKVYFANFEERKQHLIEHHRDQILVCNLCPSVYETEHSMIVHVKDKHKHIDSSLISCKHCSKEFWLTKSLLYHMDDTHEDQDTDVEKNFICSVGHCQRRFRLQEFLQRHVRDHEARKAARSVRKLSPTNKETSPCPTCGKLIPNAKMSIHLKTHSVTPQLFECKDCDKSYSSKQKLKAHHLSKHSNLTLVCPIQTCSKVFHSRPVLKNHLAGVHGDKTVYPCERCDKTFAYRGDLNIHIKGVHEGQMAYCRVCDKAFIRSSEKNRHEKQVHNINKHTNIQNAVEMD